MVRNPLEYRIAALRGRVRRLLALHGLSRVVGALLLAVIAAGLADWLFPGHLAAEVRLTLLLALIGLLGWLTLRFVIRPLVVRFRDLDIALRIETRWPGLNDRLSSTIEFLRARGQVDEDQLGSRALRDATVAQTLKEAESIDFRAVVDPRPVRRASLLALGALLIGLGLVWAAPESSRIALTRLFTPYGSTEWPKLTHLSVTPSAPLVKIARGEPFTLAVAVGKGERVPTSAKVTYRFASGDQVNEALRPDEKGVFHGRIDAVNQDFQFSVVAGDDATGRQAVKVVPPPALKDVLVRLTAPTYTGLPVQTLAPGHNLVRALEGTTVDILAVANKPIATALLHRGDGQAKASAGAPKVKIEGDGRQLSTRFVVNDSAPFWFGLTDTEGFSNTREAVRYEVRAVKDEKPRVEIVEPESDRDVVANFELPVKIAVDDDYGIQSIRLLYKVASGSSEATNEAVISLWAPPAEAAGPSRHQEVTYRWDLTPLKLTPGSIVTFHADSSDFDNIKGPNLGKSRELRLRILSPEEWTRSLEDQRRAIRDAAEKVLEMEKSAITPVKEARRVLDQTNHLDRPARDNLKNAGMLQHQVGVKMTGRTDGLEAKIRQFLDDLRNSKVDLPDAQKQMEEMMAGVDRIRDNHLGPAEQGVSRATKAADEGADPDKPSPGAERTQPQPQPSAGKPEAAKGASPAPNEPKPSAADKAEGKASDTSPAPNEPKEGPAEKAEVKPSAASQGESSKGEASKGSPSAEAAKSSLAQAEKNQTAIADELKKMLDGLKEFDSYRGMVQDAEKVLKAQEAAMKQAAEAAAKPEMQGKAPENLTPAQKADLDNLANRQSDVAKDLQNLEAKLDETAKRIDEADPLAAAALRDAAEQSRGQGTTAKMGQSAEQLGKNQMGSAQAGQKQAQQNLKELVNSLKNRREKELARLVKALKDAQKDLAKLHERQAELLKKTREAKNNPDAKARAEQLQKLAKEQADLKKELEGQLQKLAKLNANRAGKAGAAAAGKMGKAQKDMEEDQGDPEKEEKDALADLENAQDELDDDAKEAEEELAMEQLYKMKDELTDLSERQKKIVAETEDYEKKRAESGDKLTFAQRTGIRDLGQVQSGMRGATGALAERLEGAPVFALTLKRAAKSMDDASGRLKTLKTDPETQKAEKAAARRLEQLLDALKPDPKDVNGNSGGGPPGGFKAVPQDGLPTAAQIKMLKFMQNEVNERTEEIDLARARNKGELNPDQKGELAGLEDDQRTIADLARDLTIPKKDDGEE